MGKTAQRAKARAKKTAEVEAPDQAASQVPVGMIPHLVYQRVFEYLPVFYEALKEIHTELAEIKKLLKE